MYQAFLSEKEPGSGVGTPRGCFWRNKQMVLNVLNVGGRGDFRTETVDRTLDVMDKIYTTAPVERQSKVARQLAIEHADLAPQMSYEARFSGHVVVRQAIDDSGRVAYLNCNPFDSITAWRESERDEMFGASDATKPQLISKWLDDNQQAYDRTEFLFKAAVQGDHQIVQLLLDSGVPPLLDSDPSMMPLHAACFNGNLECAKILHESGIDIDFQDEFGSTPLMRAAGGNHPDIVKWLLEKGADPLRKETREGEYDALVYGAGHDPSLVRMLLDAGAQASPNSIKAAASHGKESTFDLLLIKAGFPDPEAVILDRAGDEIGSETFSDEQLDALRGALSLSGPSGSLYVARRLLKYLSISGVASSLNEKALDFKNDIANAALSSIAEDHADLLELFVSTYVQTHLGLDEESQIKEGLLTNAKLINKCLQEAAGQNALKCARLLLEKFSADVAHLDPSGNGTPFHHAARNGNVEMIRMLVTDFKADIHQSGTQASNGPTALWVAIMQQQEWAARALLELGGPVDFVDETRLDAGESPGVAVKQDGHVRAFVAARTDHKSPLVRVLNNMDQSWNVESLEPPPETERFLCLEFPGGWNQVLAARRVDDKPEDGL